MRKESRKNKLTFLPFVINCRKNHTTSNLPSDLKCIRLFIPMFSFFFVSFCVFFLCSIYNTTTTPPLYNRCSLLFSKRRQFTILVCLHSLIMSKRKDTCLYVCFNEWNCRFLAFFRTFPLYILFSFFFSFTFSCFESFN